MCQIQRTLLHDGATLSEQVRMQQYRQALVTDHDGLSVEVVLPALKLAASNRRMQRVRVGIVTSSGQLTKH